MRITIDLPDELIQQTEAEAQRRGIPLRELLQEGLRKVLPAPTPTTPTTTTPGLSVYDLVKDDVGCVDAGVDDLATNPKYMEGFGRDSMGDS